MFTGIIETIGHVSRIERRGDVQRTTVRCPEIMDEVHLGDSIAVDGVCQTVAARTAESFQFESVPETLRLTTIGTWQVGRRVNVERSLKVGARVGGHWVLGHVDGVIHLLERREFEDTAEFRFTLPREIAAHVARKGSVAIDGVSLTVAEVNGESFTVALIPYTLTHTTLGEKRPGDACHIETDVLAKYVERCIRASADATRFESLLRRAGFIGGNM